MDAGKRIGRTLAGHQIWGCMGSDGVSNRIRPYQHADNMVYRAPRKDGGVMTEHKYKKFIVFGIDKHDAIGGLGDIIDSADTIEEAIALAKKCEYEYVDIVDRDTWEYIA